MLQNLYSWLSRQFEDQKPKGAIAALDGVRALAFLIVLTLHMSIMTGQLGLWNQDKRPFVSALFAAGFSGVTLFFVLSGFLLFLPYAQSLLFQKSWPSIKIFYMRRILRIWPLYFFSLFIFIMAGHPNFINPHEWKNLLPFLTFTMGFQTSQVIDGPYWSLAVEFQYYILLPFLALAMAGLICWLPTKLRFWGVNGCLLLMIAWGLATRRWGDYYIAHPQDPWLASHHIVKQILDVIYGDKGKYLEDFAVGMLVATLYTFVRNSAKKDQYQRLLGRLGYGLVAFCVALFILGAMRNYTSLVGYTWPVAPRFFAIAPWTTEFCFALSYGCLVLAVLFARSSGLLQRIFAWNPLRWLGLLTYSLYVWHVPFLFDIQFDFAPAIIPHLPPLVSYIICWIMVLSIAVTFSFITYMMIEKPAMRLSDRLRQTMLAQRTPPVPQLPLAPITEEVKEVHLAR